MHILVVGNVLKDVYLNLDSRTENFERDGDGKEWLDFSFDSSEHHYFSRTSSFGGAAITLEVLQKMGLSADITDTSFHFDETGPVISGPTGTYRYILTSDNGTSYMVPSSPQKTSFTTPTESVDYLYVDRSAYLTPAIVDKIAAYLDYYKKTKLVLYVKTSSADEVAGLVRHASLIFLEEDAPLYTAKEALEGYPQEKIIRISEKSLGYMDFRENISIDEFLDKLEGQIQTGTRYRKSLDIVYNEGLEDDCVSFIFQKNINNEFYFCDTPVEIVYLPPNEISAVENALDVEINIEDTGRYLLYLDYDASRYSEDEMKNFALTFDEILRLMQRTQTHVHEILR